MMPGILKVLKTGGYYLIDEFENHFNKKIIEFLLGLFTDVRTNPKSACLIFSTHYPEILDFITRTDDIYICRRNEQSGLVIDRLYALKNMKRNDVSKSNLILKSIISGMSPNA